MLSDESEVVLRVVLTVKELRLINEYLYGGDWDYIPGDIDDALDKIRKPVNDFISKL